MTFAKRRTLERAEAIIKALDPANEHRKPLESLLGEQSINALLEYVRKMPFSDFKNALSASLEY